MSSSGSGAASTGADPFSGAKANIRDTVKWLTTALAALATAILAGSPLTGIGSLTGMRLALALVGAAIGLIFIFWAIAIALALLMSESFSLTQLKTDKELLAFFERRSADVLPPEFESIAALLKTREQAIATMRQTVNDPNRQKEYEAAAEFFRSLDGTIARMVSLGHFELLSRNLKSKALPLFLLAAGAVVGLGLFAWAANPPKSTEPAGSSNGVVVDLDPGPGWSAVAKAWSDACNSSAPLKATVRGETQPGWLDVQLHGTGSCAGVRLVLPSALRALPGASAGPQRPTPTKP